MTLAAMSGQACGMADVDAIIQSFHDSADYAETASRTKALTHQTACRRLLVQLPTVVGKGGRGGVSVEISDANVRRALDDVSRWLDSNPDLTSQPDVIYPDFNGFRGT